MGQHTAFIMKCELKADTPQQVIDTLKFMTSPNDEEELDNLPDHPLFETEEWEYMLWTGGGILWNPKSSLNYNNNNKTYSLNIRCSVKDEGGHQVRLFLHWITPFSSTEGFLGFFHPEYEPIQSRILFENGRAYIVEPIENSLGFEDLVPAEDDNRMKNLIQGLISMAKNEPEFALTIEQQLNLVESMAKSDPKTATRLNIPEYKSLKELLNKSAERSGESQDEE